MKILLQPASNKQATNNYEDTISKGVSVNILSNFLQKHELEKIIKNNEKSDVDKVFYIYDFFACDEKS